MDDDIDTRSADNPPYYQKFCEARELEDQFPQDAINLYLECLALNSEFWRAYQRLGLILVFQAQYDLALKYLSIYLDQKGYDAETYDAMGIAYSEKGDYVTSIRCFSMSLLLNPRSQSSYFNMGVVFQKSNDHDNALRAFSSCIDLEPGSYQAQLHIALLYKAKGCYEDAIDRFKVCLEIDSENPQAIRGMALVYYSIQQIQEAKKWLSKLDQGEGHNADTLFMKGNILVYEDKYIEALNYFQKAYDLVEDKKKAHAIVTQTALAYCCLINEIYFEYRTLLKAKKGKKSSFFQ